MRRGTLVFVLVFLVAAAPGNGGHKSATPAEQYKALLKEYQNPSSGGAASDEERMQLVGRAYKLRYKLALRFVELAERNPNDPIALDALMQAVWQVNNIPWPVGLVVSDPADAVSEGFRSASRSVASLPFGIERTQPLQQSRDRLERITAYEEEAQAEQREGP